MKLAIGGIYHETHTFPHKKTSLDDFKREVYAGKDIIRSYQSTKTSLGGFTDEALRNGDIIYPTFYAAATPSGMVSQDAFEKMSGELLDRIKKITPEIDGFLLAQHGAMVTEDMEDPEGYLITEIKKILSGKPLVVTTDFHANISRKMVLNSDCIVGYDTYPHIDIYERAIDAYTIIRKIIKEKISIKKAFLPIPLIAAPQAIGTSISPMKEAINIAHKYEEKQEILNITVAGGFAYSDIKRTGMSITVSFISGLDGVKRITREIGDSIWKKRESLEIRNTPIDAAIDDALSSRQYPVVLVDVADNIGGGTPGDGTELLRSLIERKADRAVIVISDKISVLKCFKKGIREDIELDIGGKTDNLHGKPIRVSGYIKLLSDGIFHNIGKNMTGLENSMGKTVLLVSGGIKIVLTERPTPPNDPAMLLSIGIDITREKILVVKGAIAWKTGLNISPAKTIYVDTPGLCSADLNSFDFNNLRYPIYPFNKDNMKIDLNDLIEIL